MIPKAVRYILASTIANSVVFTAPFSSTQASEPTTEAKGPEGTEQIPIAQSDQPQGGSVLRPAIPPPQRPPKPPPHPPPAPPRIFSRMTTSDISKRITENLAKAQNSYDVAKKEKDKNKSAYIIALVDLATACHENKEIDKAGKLYSEAFELYLKLGKNSPDEEKCRLSLYRHIGYLPPEEFESKFEQLLLIAEKKTPGEWIPMSNLNQFIATAAADQRSNDRDTKSDEPQFWKSVIRIRSSVRGPSDPTLEFPLRSYAYSCEQHADLKEAEEAFKRNANLKGSQSADAEIRAKLQLAEFYARHKMFDKGTAYWPTLKASINPRLSSGIAWEFARLGEDYLNVSRTNDAEEIAFAVLDGGGDEALSPLTQLLEKIMIGHFDNFEYSKAQTLLKRRVAASEKAGHDDNASYWRLKLSDVDLALGEVAESEKLFEQVKIDAALHKQDVDKLLKKRAALIQALKKK
jgi:hypothetical protein